MSSSVIPILLFTNSDGESFDFRASWVNLTGLAGFEGGLVSHRRVESPLRDGSVYLNSRMLDLMPIVSFTISGSTFATLQQRRRQVESILRPRTGLGILSYQPFDGGPQYETDALIERRAGAERRDGFGQQETWTVQFRLPNANWRRLPAIQTAFPDGGEAVSAESAGDGQSFPIVTFTPEVDVRGAFIENQTTNAHVELRDVTILSTDEVVFDMDRKTVLRDGSSLLGFVTVESVFWPLAAGANLVAGGPPRKMVGLGQNSGSGTAWSNANEISNESQTVPTGVASVSLTASGSSQLLVGRSLGLSVPVTATILGVRALYRAHQTSDGLRHAVVQLWDGELIGTNKGGTAATDVLHLTAASPATFGTKAFGGGAELWGATLTPGVVNASAFGVALRVTNPAGPTGTTSVANVAVEVWYENGGALGSQWAMTHFDVVDGV